MEFYRIARSMLPADCFINPDVFTTDFMDFYVNSDLCWGIELVRNEDSLEEHLARFLPRGRYGPMIAQGHIKEWALLAVVPRTTANHLTPALRPIAPLCYSLWITKPRRFTMATPLDQ